MEENDVIDGCQSSEDFGPLVFGDERAVRSFVPANARVPIDAHDQHVAERARLFEKPNMPGMKEIETSVREDNELTIAFPSTDVENQLFLGDHLTQCARPLPLTNRFSNFKFYHAGRSQR